MHLIRRRSYLAGLGLGAGHSLLAPFCRGLIRDAWGQASRRKRLIVVGCGNGLMEAAFTCKARSETDFDLTESLAPLARYKKDLLVMSKFHNPFGVDTHGNHWAGLTVAGERGRPGGISLDRLAARTLSQGDPISSTNVMIWDQGDSSDSFHFSADGPGQEYPAEWNPVRLHGKLFGKAASQALPGVDPQQLLARHRSVLDFVVGDTQRLRTRLAGPERAKLDQYLTSLTAVETQLTKLAQARPPSGGISAPALTTSNDFKDKFVQPAVVKALIDVSFNALAGGLTHVAAISLLANCGSFKIYEFPEGKVDHHRICHGSSATLASGIVKIDRWRAEQVAYLADRLSAVAEGGGSLFDQSLILWVNTGGGVHHGGHNTHAVITVGNAGKALRTGRYLTFPPMRHCISDAYVSVARAVGVDITTFGAPAACKGPLPGLG